MHGLFENIDKTLYPGTQRLSAINDLGTMNPEHKDLGLDTRNPEIVSYQ